MVSSKQMQFKLSILVSIATMAVAAMGAAVPNLEKRGDDQFLLIGFEKQVTNVNSTGLGKRDKYYTNPLINEKLLYITYLEFGSDNQKIGVDVDTGSADLWVPDSNAQPPHGGFLYGTYSPGESSSAQDTNENFQISYVDGTQVYGDYYTDSVRIGDSTLGVLKNFQFADATTTPLGYGIFGIGRDQDEATSNTYPNFLDRLKSDKLIKTAAYSVFLNDPNAQTGTIIFGGKDLDKIDGTLAPQPIVNYNNLAITLGSVTVNGETINSGENSVLDSGTTYAAFTRSLGDQIFSNYDNAQYNDQLGVWLVNSDKNVDQPVTFNFNGVSITTSLAAAYTDDVVDVNGNSYGPGFNIIAYDFNLLGDIFLSQAYVVYDYDKNTVSIAKAKFTSSSNIVAI